MKLHMANGVTEASADGVVVGPSNLAVKLAVVEDKTNNDPYVLLAQPSAKGIATAKGMNERAESATGHQIWGILHKGCFDVYILPLG